MISDRRLHLPIEKVSRIVEYAPHSPEPVRGLRAMRERFVYAALVLVICGAIYLVTQGMNLIYQPSNAKVAAGVGLIVLVLVLFPAAMKWIWPHKTTPHNQPYRQ